MPDHLRELLLEALLLAAQRVVEFALAEAVDFVVLAGDVADVRRAGPAGAAFVIRQLDRLHNGASWSIGPAAVWTARKWPPTIGLPDNVRRFAQRQVEGLIHCRGETAVARILGVAAATHRRVPVEQFDETAQLPTVAIAHGRVDPLALHGRNIAYWALGGRHNRRTLFSERHAAVYAGTPQGRHASESGTHGCTLVEMEADGRVRTRFLPTDLVRFENETILLDEAQELGEVNRRVRDRLSAFRRIRQTPTSSFIGR